jgi:ABC-type bacteriocin/lantibiotic exporter with double-glycine peptidase domain
MTVLENSIAELQTLKSSLIVERAELYSDIDSIQKSPFWRHFFESKAEKLMKIRQRIETINKTINDINSRLLNLHQVQKNLTA